jgi:hypothetical protein
MNEMLSHSPAVLAELVEARNEHVRQDVARSRAGATWQPQRAPLRAGIAGIAALLGAPARHRAA